jgi:hypothetical protein
VRVTRRRRRRIDSLASVAAIESILQQLRVSLPDIIPRTHKQLIQMLHSVRHTYTHTATDTKRGRPGRFSREHLLKVDSQLRLILQRETNISVRSFVGQYLPILEFPRDVREALESGDINLFEAHQLARLNIKRLRSTEAEARYQRLKILEAHLRSKESGIGLRARVREALGEACEPDPTRTEVLAVEKADEMLEIDPVDSAHLFFEELRRISRALRVIEPEDLTDEMMGSLMPLLDQLSTFLYQIERGKQKQQEVKKIRI